MNTERRRGPSTYALSFVGIIAVAALIAMGVATYNSLQNDIAILKRERLYQVMFNDRISEEARAALVEQREAMKQFNDKLDKIIDKGKNNGTF